MPRADLPKTDRWRRFRQGLALKLFTFYPPYLGAGVRVRRPAPDTFEVSMKLRWWNRNYVGTHFGGSLYSMCDPFFMLLVFDGLGNEYVVWDKAATIRFLRPGRGRVTARFTVPPERLEEIRRDAETAHKVEPVFTARVTHDDGEVVAEVEKRLYVRKKRKEPGAAEV